MAMDLGALLGGVLSGGGGPQITDNRVINLVSSPLQNLGAILNGMNTGPSNLGGTPLIPESALGRGLGNFAFGDPSGLQYAGLTPQEAGFGGNLFPIGIGLGVLALALFVFRKKIRPIQG